MPVQHHQHHCSGLKRSPSRVLRFKSAKEFFERLSSANSPTTAGGGLGAISATSSPSNGHHQHHQIGTTANTNTPTIAATMTPTIQPPECPTPTPNEPESAPAPKQQTSPALPAPPSAEEAATTTTIPPPTTTPTTTTTASSLLIRRNKQLCIKFDENLTTTYEYPSEESLMAGPGTPTSPSPPPTPPQPTLNQSTTTTITTGADGSLTNIANYKPSILKSDLDENKNDEKFDIKNQIAQNRSNFSINAATPPVKTRTALDHWSSNDGSVIYTQPAKGNINVILDTKQKIYSHSMGNGGLRAKENSNLPIGYNTILTKNPKQTSDIIEKINDTIGVQYNKSPILKPQWKENTRDLITAATNALMESRDNLNVKKTFNWSNGTTVTSDLLF